MTYNVPNFPARAVAVTESDATYFEPSTLYVGTGGNVTVQPEVGGNTVEFANVPSGYVIPVRVIRVLEATTASNIVRVS